MALNTTTIDGRITLFGSTSTTSESGVGIPILIEADGTLRFQSVLFHSGTTQIREKSETDGSPIVSNYGKASGTLTAFKVESTGEQDIVLHGKDSAGPNIDALLTDVNRILWNRNYRDPILQDGVVLALTATTVYTCPASTIAEEVWIEVTSNDDAPRTVDIFVDYDGTGVANTEAVLDTVTLGGNSLPIRLGPYSLQATGTVRGLCSNGSSVTARVFGWTRPSAP